MQYLEPFYFFIALFIGMFLAYIYTPSPDVIIKYPTPENAGEIIYKDNADVCYKYEANEVECPKDKSKIKETELQQIDLDKKEKEGVFTNLSKRFSK